MVRHCVCGANHSDICICFNTVQSNTIAESLKTQYNVSPIITGVILAIITAIIIFGGVRSIATLSSIIVPVMAIIYIGLVAVILIFNYDQIIPMIATIIKMHLDLNKQREARLEQPFCKV